ncbi:DNA-directed RNA polymerase specialized sigma24 family protein [Pedobacter sp. UYP30]|uniref:hypothetical protein n=1 Tax=Pedobacter sp. UYP30 TaxID=1756400 RepID=UPI00339A27D4
MPSNNTLCNEDIKVLLLSVDRDCYEVLREYYGPQVYGQFASFCREGTKAAELTHRVFEMAAFEIEENSMVKGSLLIWLMNISRKVARTYLLDYSVKKSSDDRCIRRLVVSEGFNLPEAAGVLGISKQEAIIRLRTALKG